VVLGATWVKSNLPEMQRRGQRGQQQAAEFANGHTQQECIDEGFRRHDACGAGMEIMCRAEVRIFIDQCLRQAQETPGVCDAVPPPNEIMRSATWQLQYCRDHGHINDQNCSNYVARPIVEYCGRR
jgi:hypothetical protein